MRLLEAWIVKSLLVCACFCVAVVPTWGEDAIYVHFGSIQGSSTDPEHEGWVEAFALSHYHSKSCDFGSSGGGGGPCGNPNFGDLSFLKQTDLATIGLHQVLTSQMPLGTVVIEVCRQSSRGPQECYYRIQLTDARVLDLSLAGNACTDPGACGGRQTESVSLEFVRIEWTFVPYADGVPGTPISRCWNLQSNGPC